MAKERIYETMIIVKTDMTQEERDSVVAMVKGWIEEKVEGTIQESVRWGIRKLAYEIPKGHIKEGDYNYFIYSASPEKVAVLDENFQIHHEIIRYQTIRREDLEKKASKVDKSITVEEPVVEETETSAE
ncbi:MAG: 30S ribosomal protein S6 [Thermotogae bacterium]|nr:30S ribosomal protein S6 [Thermotogota bacterium]HOO75234.1 30S ribosomal protein S6 [Tepiditoga sp.]